MARQVTKSGPPATPTAWKRLISEIQKRARTAGDPALRALLQHELDAANDGLRAAQKTSAMSANYVTDTNLFALTQLVIDRGGPVFLNTLYAVDRPHIKRCLEAGLIEVVGPARRLRGVDRLQLTPAGRTAVADMLIRDIERESKYTPAPNAFITSAETRDAALAKDNMEHEAKLHRLERTLASLRS